MESLLTFYDKPVLIDGAVVEMKIWQVKALAERLGRDYKRVNEDVETLTASGPLSRANGGVSAPYDAITAEMRL
jgi:predicted transcriptional regulator